tara:strand:+ start:3633 stop:3977 length:345 start_codon:yes stop_codon:yes gene_type:complete
MRVRISYGMEVEDIPEQAEKMGREAYVSLMESAKQLQNALEMISDAEGDYELVLSLFDKVRHKLTKSDLIIADLLAILRGLQTYNNGDYNVSEGRPTMDSGGNTTTSTSDPGEG